MVQDPRDLVEHHPDVLRAQRNLDAEQALDGEAVRVLVAHHGHVVQPVHVRQRLQIRPGLGELLGGPVQEADVRVGALDDLAVELQHQPQHAVRGRMLRAKVHRVIANLCHLAQPPIHQRPVAYVSSRMIRGVISRGSIVTGW